MSNDVKSLKQIYLNKMDFIGEGDPEKEACSEISFNF